MKMKQLILCPMFFLCFDAQFLLRKNVMELWRDVHRTIRGVDDKDYVEFLTIQVCAHYCHCIGTTTEILLARAVKTLFLQCFPFNLKQPLSAMHTSR